MNDPVFKPRGLYFEEFERGYKLATAGRTITESDIVNFAGLSGDFNQLHTDAIFAEKEPFGQRIAHGLLVQSIATGLAVQTGFIEGTVIAFRELSCKFIHPVAIGDTIYVQLEINELKAFPRIGGGQVDMTYNVLNQEAKVIQRGNWVMLVKSKPNERP